MTEYQLKTAVELSVNFGLKPAHRLILHSLCLDALNSPDGPAFTDAQLVSATKLSFEDAIDTIQGILKSGEYSDGKINFHGHEFAPTDF